MRKMHRKGENLTTDAYLYEPEILKEIKHMIIRHGRGKVIFKSRVFFGLFLGQKRYQERDVL